jgi:hypothetical protein
VHGTVATPDQAHTVPPIRLELYGLPTRLLRLVPVLLVVGQLMTIKFCIRQFFMHLGQT